MFHSLLSVPVLAAGLMGGGMTAMAGLGLVSTSKIVQSNAKRFELEWAQYHQQNRYLDMREQEIDPSSQYNRMTRQWDIEDAERDHIYYQENLALQDQLYKQNQANQFSYNSILNAQEYGYDQQLQADRLQTDVNLDTRRIQIQDEERNLYLQNLAFDTSQALLKSYSFNDDKPINEIQLEILKLSYIISEIEKIEQNNPNMLSNKLSHDEPYNAYDENFDYSLWHPVPDQ